MYYTDFINNNCIVICERCCILNYYFQRSTQCCHPSVSGRPRYKMHATALISLLTVAVLITTICSLSEARVLCTPCINRIDCNEPPSNCQWGKARDICNRLVCAKGPGERCGGTFEILGSCGEGMMCTTTFLDKNVERCQGCSTLTLECYP